MKTDVTVILDRSGSMESIKADMEGGFNAFIQEQRKIEGECSVSLVQFDTQYEEVYSGKSLAEVPPLQLVPRGGTALQDALGRTINAIGARLAALPEAERPQQVVVITITDGEENSSHEFSAAKVKEMIEHQQTKYNWVFTFLGANQDAVLAANRFGIAAGDALSYGANQAGVQNSYGALGGKLCAIRTSGMNTAYSAQERADAMGS